MLTLSIRQPWAWLIVRPDITGPRERAAAMLDGRIKTVENRTWPTRYRGSILIHASKGMTRAQYEDAEDPLWASRGPTIELPAFEDLQRGGICAVSAMPPDEKRLRYVTGILRKRLSYVPFDVLRTLKAAHRAGVDVDAMVDEAKFCRNWTAFSDWLDEESEG